MLVTVELPSAYSQRPSLFIHFFSDSPDSEALVPTFKSNRADNQIKSWKLLWVWVFLGEGFTAANISFSSDSLIADESLKFLYKVQESNCNASALHILPKL